MNAMKCDRCGKFYTKNENKYKEKFNGHSVSYINLGTETNSYGNFDLCDCCVYELMIFLKREKSK